MLLDAPSRLAAALLPRVWSRLPARGQTLYLTFDDGPSEATSEVLDVLAEQGAHATFFVLEERATAEGERVRRILEEGHTLGSHGRQHTDPWRTRDPQRWRGTHARWLRPPYGHLTPALLRYAHRHDRHIALWDVMPADFETVATPDAIAERVLRRIRPGSIVVLHDGPEMSGRIGPILQQLLTRLCREDWQLLPLPPQPGEEV